MDLMCAVSLLIPFDEPGVKGGRHLPGRFPEKIVPLNDHKRHNGNFCLLRERTSTSISITGFAAGIGIALMLVGDSPSDQAGRQLSRQFLFCSNICGHAGSCGTSTMLSSATLFILASRASMKIAFQRIITACRWPSLSGFAEAGKGFGRRQINRRLCAELTREAPDRR
jgi:hypothetical protein